jgi:hypothetical protein
MCGLPNWLEITLERDGGPSYRVTLEGMALEYQASVDGVQYGLVERIRPRAQAWRDFLTALEAAGIRQWETQYRGEGAAVRWSIELAAPGRQIATSGINAYPPNDAFPRACAALRELLGGRAFG